MAAYFLCLTAGGGVPLFSRTKGDLKPLPFPVIGSLNGVHMFANTHDVDLLTTTTHDAKIVWKVFHNSLTLIVVSRDDNASDAHLTKLLDYIFQAMVLVYGLDELINIKNIERFKREIKVCYKMVDGLLDQADSLLFCDLTHCVDVILSTQNSILQGYLHGFVEAADSPFGCLMVSGKVAVATQKWWELSGLELVLVSALIMSLPPCSSRDLPIFLPVGSPSVPHRLLTFQLLSGVEVCLICGPSPTLAELQREVGRFWRPALDSLKSMTKVHPRNFPVNIVIDPSILGFILVNSHSHRCLCTVQPISDDKRSGQTISIPERRRILRAFYRTVVGNQWRPPLLEASGSQGNHDQQPRVSDLYKGELLVALHYSPHILHWLLWSSCILCGHKALDAGLQQSKPPTSFTASPSSDLHQSLRHRSTDTYLCAERHKCYALQTAPYQMFLLFTHTIPTYAMRSVARKTLTILLHDKNVQL